MTAEPVDLLALAHLRPLTIDDLPDEDALGRTELIEGSLYVTPGADFEHQLIVSDLLMRLRDRTPAGVVALPGVNVIDGDATLVIPDVVVADPDMLVRDGLGVSPAGVLLAVEITSPSTRTHDLTIKRKLYEDWGVPYVLVDRRTQPATWSTFTDLPSWAFGILPY